MKKNGFTLAEVLVTLGIIGIIAALTLPHITANTKATQIGPKLAKAVSAIEQAGESLLHDQSVDSMADLGYATSDYASGLTNYMKASNSDGTLTGNDGVNYKITLDETVGGASTDAPHKRKAGSVEIDINGTGVKPDEAGTDIFYFTLYSDGSLAPKGGKYNQSIDPELGTWETYCPKEAVPTDYSYCAGHIFENNMKVLYIIK